MLMLAHPCGIICVQPIPLTPTPRFRSGTTILARPKIVDSLGNVAGVRSWSDGSRQTETALFALADSQPEKSEATSDDEGYPAYRLRHRPIPDGDGPLLKNPHQMEKRDHREDYPSHQRKCFLVHERSSPHSFSTSRRRDELIIHSKRITSGGPHGSRYVWDDPQDGHQHCC
jgi:hypothetical protein